MSGAAVALVLVSHSKRLAEGVAELAAQMAPDVVLVPAGGTDDGRLGTGFEVVERALSSATDAGRSVVILTDLGSAVLTAESVLEFADDDVVARVRIADAPFVEGAVAAAVAAQGGVGLGEVVRAAEDAARTFGGGGTEPRLDRAAVPPAEGGAPGGSPSWGPVSPEDVATRAAADGSGTGADGYGTDASGSGTDASDAADAHTGAVHADPGDEETTVRGTAVLRNRLGLHARPAAQLARTAGAFRSTIEVNGVDARSVLSVIALGAVGGTHLAVTASGPDAAMAVRAVVAELEEGFGEA